MREISVPRRLLDELFVLKTDLLIFIDGIDQNECEMGNKVEL